MKIGAAFFKGELPRISPRNLPPGAAQLARNARLLTTDLTAWKEPLLKAAITTAFGEPISLYKLVTQNAGADVFLRWPTDVSVARGPIPGDTTERLYFTGAPDDPDDVGSARRPKVTNFQMAVTDPPRAGLSNGQYPHDWLLLGVPAPVDAPDVELLLTGVPATSLVSDGSDLTGWTKSENTGGRIVSVSLSQGNPVESFLVHDSGETSEHAYLYRDLGHADAVLTLIDFDHRGGRVIRDTNVDGTHTVVYQARASTVLLCGDDDGTGLALSITAGLSGATGSIQVVGGEAPFASFTNLDIDYDVFYHYEVEILRNDADNATMHLLVRDAGDTTTILDQTITVPTSVLRGGRFGLDVGVPDNMDLSEPGLVWIRTYDMECYLDNVRVYFSPTVTDAVQTAYVYTFINELGEEGPPSDPSEYVARPSGYAVRVSGFDLTGAADYGVTTIRLYRAITGSTGTEFRKVTEFSTATTQYDDTLADEDLGIVLESTSWDLPPADGHSILALPNGITLMASKNTVCPSEQNRPHAYPEDYRLSTDFPIVAMGAIDTTAFALTQSHPYIVIGSNPGALSMAKLEYPYGCVSRRSVANLKGFGVVYASPDGLVALSGAAAPQLISGSFFTRDQWQALKPESITAIAHDDRYYFFYDTGAVQGGYCLDPKPDGNGLVPLDASDIVGAGVVDAAYTDPLTDKLFVVVNGTIYTWDAGADLLPYVWRSQLFQLPYPTSLACAQVRGDNLVDAAFGPLQFRLYADGVLVDERDITAEGEFVLSAHDAAKEYYFELEGAARVESVWCAEDMEELA